MEHQLKTIRYCAGDFIREEIDARGWTKAYLAEKAGVSVDTIHRVITGNRAITSDVSSGLAVAFGTSAEYWLNLQKDESK